MVKGEKVKKGLEGDRISQYTVLTFLILNKDCQTDCVELDEKKLKDIEIFF